MMDNEQYQILMHDVSGLEVSPFLPGWIDDIIIIIKYPPFIYQQPIE